MVRGTSQFNGDSVRLAFVSSSRPVSYLARVVKPVRLPDCVV